MTAERSARKKPSRSQAEILAEANLALAQAVASQAETIRVLAGDSGRSRLGGHWPPSDMGHDLHRVEVSVVDGALQFKGDKRIGLDEAAFLKQVDRLGFSFHLAETVDPDEDRKKFLQLFQAFIDRHAVITGDVMMVGVCCRGF